MKRKFQRYWDDKKTLEVRDTYNGGAPICKAVSRVQAKAIANAMNVRNLARRRSIEQRSQALEQAEVLMK